MNSKQRVIIIALAALNFMIFGAVCLVLFSFVKARRSQISAQTTSMQVVEKTAVPPTATETPTATATATPSRTRTPAPPKPTNTLVVSRPTPFGGAPTLPATVLEDGWKLYEVRGDSVAIALPPTWDESEMDAASIQSMIDAVAKKNPEMASALRRQTDRLLDSGLKFFAADVASARDPNFVTNLNLFHEQLPASISMDTFVRAALSNMPSLITVKSHKRVVLPVGEAEEIHSEYPLEIGGGKKLILAATQYCVLRGKQAYIITLTTTRPLESGYSATFDKIARSFRWTDRDATD